MAILGNTHEEASLNGTGISHVPLAGRPEFGGLTPGATPDDPPSVMIRDGALQIVTDDIDLALAWRNAWQSAVSHLVIHRQRSGKPALPPVPAQTEPDYERMDSRTATIAGLRALAAFLEANPEVPALEYGYSFQHSASAFTATYEDAVAEVDRVAKLLDVEPGKPWEGANYQANKRFGPVSYHAVAVEPKAESEAS